MMSKQDNEQTHRYKTEIRGLKDENKRLQRELHRKEKALAEAAALMILKKKRRCCSAWTRTIDPYVCA